MSVRILQGDALSMLRTLPAKSVQCVVTSPPYFQLRDYGVDGQIGLERTPAAFLDALYAVFDEVKRVLRDDGCVFVNLGDSYAGSGKGPTGVTGYGDQARRQGFVNAKTEYGRPKSLLLIPERFAIGMADRGWIVRSQIVWAKKSAMPESVRDRPTSAWEPIWMFTKQARYYWDQTALAQAVAGDDDAVRQVKYTHGDETLPGVRHGSTVVGLLSAERSAEDGMQAVRTCPHHGMEADRQGQGFGSGDAAEVQRERGRKSEASGVQPLGRAPEGESGVRADGGRTGVDGSVSPDREAEGREETALRERQGQGIERPVSGDRQGQRIVVAGSPSAQGAETGAAAADEHANGGRVGGDPSGIRECLCVLRPFGSALDAGSHRPAVEGRPSRQGQHSAGVPLVQQPQEQSRAAAPNARNVWVLGPEPSRLSHYAAYPTELVRRCILAATSEKGQCPACSAPWRRVVERDGASKWAADDDIRDFNNDGRTANPQSSKSLHRQKGGVYSTAKVLGWEPSCKCDAGDPVPQTVLDPFLGSGTTALVADRLERDAIGIELNEKYVQLAERRLRSDSPMFSDVTVVSPSAESSDTARLLLAPLSSGTTDTGLSDSSVHDFASSGRG